MIQIASLSHLDFVLEKAFISLEKKHAPEMFQYFAIAMAYLHISSRNAHFHSLQVYNFPADFRKILKLDNSAVG